MPATDAVYQEGMKLCETVRKMKLTDLLALNPTLGDLFIIFKVASIGHGQDADEESVREVKAILYGNEPKLKLQDIKRASKGKFRLIVLVDSEQYQLGEDQDTIIRAIALFQSYGKKQPACIFDDKGDLKMQLA